MENMFYFLLKSISTLWLITKPFLRYLRNSKRCDCVCFFVCGCSRVCLYMCVWPFYVSFRNKYVKKYTYQSLNGMVSYVCVFLCMVGCSLVVCVYMNLYTSNCLCFVCVCVWVIERIRLSKTQHFGNKVSGVCDCVYVYV